MTNKEFCEYIMKKNEVNYDFTVLNEYISAKQYKNKYLTDTIELLDKRIHKINTDYDKETLYNCVECMYFMSTLILDLINKKAYKSKKDKKNFEYFKVINEISYNQMVNYANYYIDLITDSLEMEEV